MTKKTSNMERI